MPQPRKAVATQPVADVNDAVRRPRILVIDDGDSVRDIIRIFLERDGFEVCGEGGDGVEAIEQAKKLKPDLIVLDQIRLQFFCLLDCLYTITTFPADFKTEA